jgi:pimeloyl-ACP methyl ester carboxylesterase
LDAEAPSLFAGRKHLHKIKCPIFLFKGEADYHVTERAVMDTIAAIPNGLAEGGIAKKMGHLMMEQPELLAEGLSRVPQAAEVHLKD